MVCPSFGNIFDGRKREKSPSSLTSYLPTKFDLSLHHREVLDIQVSWQGMHKNGLVDADVLLFKLFIEECPSARLIKALDLSWIEHTALLKQFASNRQSALCFKGDVCLRIVRARDLWRLALLLRKGRVESHPLEPQPKTMNRVAFSLDADKGKLSQFGRITLYLGALMASPWVAGMWDSPLTRLR